MATGNTPCGISIPQTFPGGRIDLGLIREFVARAEALGFDSLWVQEQMIGDIAALEPVALMNYAAALTSKARIGSSILLTVIRNPVELAKTLATLDQLSRGRVTVGVAIGNPTTPHEIFGVPREHRGRRFVEGIKVMKALWTEPRATFHGECWNFDNVAMEPKPVQKPHPPIWFGARDETALRRAVRHGDGWMGAGSSTFDDFVRQTGLIRRLLEQERRDPASFAISKRVYIAIDEDRARAERRLREWFGARYKNADMAQRVSVYGSHSECLGRLRELVRAGAKHLMLDPVFDQLEQMHLLASEIVPQL